MVYSKTLPWKLFTFVILLSTATLFLYDLNASGNWKKTHSVRTLKQIGVWEYGEKALGGAHLGLNWTRQRIEEYAPGYIDATGEYIEPYVELTKDLGKFAYSSGERLLETAKEKIPVIVEMIERNAPGLLEQINKTWHCVSNCVVEYSLKGYNYLTTEIFVGQMSPENMQKIVITTFHTTQKFAIEYYNWAYEKFDSVMSGK